MVHLPNMPPEPNMKTLPACEWFTSSGVMCHSLVKYQHSVLYLDFASKRLKGATYAACGMRVTAPVALP